jgi:hypothetical protein
VKLDRECIFATLAVFTLHLAALGWAGGFQHGYREAFGPLFRDGFKF